MKKLNSLAVLLGLIASTISLAAYAQEDSPASDLLEKFDISLSQPGPEAFPPGMPPMIGMNPGMPPAFMPGMPAMPGMPGMPMIMGIGPDPDSPESGPDELLAMRPDKDMLMLKAGVESSFSDEQLEKMYKAKSEFLDKAAPKMAELKIQERSLRDLLTQSDFDKSKAQGIQSKINGLKSDLANLKLEQRISLLNCLTPEQHKELRRNYVKFADFGPMGHHGSHRMQWRHRRGGGGGGGGGPACKPGGDCPKDKSSSGEKS